MDRHDASSQRFIAFPTVNRHSFPSRGLIHQTDGTGSTNRTVLIVFAATSDVNPKSIKWAYNSSENNKLWFCERVSGGKTCKRRKTHQNWTLPSKMENIPDRLSISHYDWWITTSWTQAPSEQDPMSNRAEQSHTEHAAYIDGQGNSQHQERWSLAKPTTSSTLAWQTIQSKVHQPQQ